ncbi:hypothetical protein CQA69_08400 [Campylobacter estrildidarum]|uniref:Uncharacterized protein n=2 Tax=Campylobacter estrildidarum TaxID=2510189 RepID=A0A4U7BF04_9BACT|nr:hypothetical protein CQA69_08400 [Campylobacter estrildidarum]
MTIGLIFCLCLLHKILKSIYRFLFIYRLYEYESDKGKALFLLLKNYDDYEYIIFSEYRGTMVAGNDILNNSKIVKYKKWIFLCKCVKNYIKRFFKLKIARNCKKTIFKCKISNEN